MKSTTNQDSSSDPLIICWAITVIFFILLLVRIDIPPFRYFDEQFYIPAAARLLLGIDIINREHPMLAKELMALALALFGNQPFGWRVGSIVAGSLGLFAAMRALWWHTQSRQATVLFGLLLSSNGLLFAMSRLAMLDVYMFGFACWAVMLFTQRNFAASGLVFGLALACKWSVLPVLAIFGATSLMREKSVRPFVWFGVLPLLVYFATFLPGMFVRDNPIRISELLPMQWDMAQFMAHQIRPHPYQSTWWQWALNARPIWLFHAELEGVYRIAVIAGNPLSSLAILPAVAIALLRRNSILAFLYLACLLFWALPGKPVQYYYYYLPAGTFGLAVLATELAGRRIAWPFILITLAIFAWLFPALTGSAFERNQTTQYTRFPGWEFRD
jgi:dolichyl-phosphate-mannose-protein mannosyltransferase